MATAGMLSIGTRNSFSDKKVHLKMHRIAGWAHQKKDSETNHSTMVERNRNTDI